MLALLQLTLLVMVAVLALGVVAWTQYTRARVAFWPGPVPVEADVSGLLVTPSGPAGDVELASLSA
jgi:hypothetical protein